MEDRGISEVGSVLCVPIPYPQAYEGQDRIGPCLGVLSITSSKPLYWKEAHATWIKKWYIDALINIVLVYKLNERLRQTV